MGTMAQVGSEIWSETHCSGGPSANQNYSHYFPLPRLLLCALQNGYCFYDPTSHSWHFLWALSLETQSESLIKITHSS
jgi:hypothetical protein